MPEFEVTVHVMAFMSQTHTVEAADAQEAREKVLSDEHDTYYGHHQWKYNGIDENSLNFDIEAQ